MNLKKFFWNTIEEEPTLDVFSFPKGAKPGSCLHGIFEEIDFCNFSVFCIYILSYLPISAS